MASESEDDKSQYTPSLPYSLSTYCIAASIFVWIFLGGLLVISSSLASEPVFIAIFGVLIPILPLAIFFDYRNIQFETEPWPRDIWVYVLLAIVPLLGVILGGIYLIQRRRQFMLSHWLKAYLAKRSEKQEQVGNQSEGNEHTKEAEQDTDSDEAANEDEELDVLSDEAHPRVRRDDVRRPEVGSGVTYDSPGLESAKKLQQEDSQNENH